MHIALIGCGNWGQYILRDLKLLNCEVTVCCLTDTIKNATTYGADHIVNSVDQIENPKGIIIATPTSTHLDIIESLSNFNVSLFVEKPLGNDLKKARVIIKKLGERIFLMDKWRYHPGIEMLSSIAKNKMLGDVIGLNITQLSWGCPHDDVDFIDILVPHSLTMTQEILGEIPTPKKCTILSYQNKPVVLGAWLGDSTICHYHVAINSPDYRREIILDCNEGIAVLRSAYSNEIEIYDKTSTKNSLSVSKKISIDAEAPLLKELKGFINYLNGGSAPKSNAQNGVHIMEKIIELRKLAHENT